MPPREVIGSYHDLWQVEASFRMSKTDLRARPIFHHTKDAIEAHLSIVFAALAISRRLQDQTGLSIKKIVRALRPIQQITITIASHPHTAADPPQRRRPRHPHRHRSRPRNTLNWRESGLRPAPARHGYQDSRD